MKSVTVTEFKKHPDQMLSTAKHEAITVTDHGKPVVIIRKVDVNESLKRLRKAVKHVDDDIENFGVFDF